MKAAAAPSSFLIFYFITCNRRTHSIIQSVQSRRKTGNNAMPHHHHTHLYRNQSWSWVTFSKPNPKFLDPTQPTKVFTQPNPTHHRHLVWHIRLYRKLHIQQLLHVTDKLIQYILQANCQRKLLFSCGTH